eukprot:TRINITY_DN793_c0_g1_i5.p1 TRINITY_DN793_c0_g1~~TRINITY_DN793_c0_g1_i5.p1  ORF type:complete len:449 (+),score=88.58 TRINITY_DN793_c0_g1_i5:676-2022(+)
MSQILSLLRSIVGIKRTEPSIDDQQQRQQVSPPPAPNQNHSSDPLGKQDGHHSSQCNNRMNANNGNAGPAKVNGGNNNSAAPSRRKSNSNTNNNNHLESDLIDLCRDDNNVRALFQEFHLKVGDVVVVNPFGFGVFTGITANDMVNVALCWATISVPRYQVSPFLPIDVISFVEDLPCFRLNLTPNDPLSTLRNKIATHFELDADKFRLAYKGVQITENEFKSCFVKEFFHDCCSVSVLFVLNSTVALEIENDVASKLPLEVTSDRLSAEMLGNKNWCTFKASRKLSKGSHSWKVKLDRCVNGNITLGVVSDGACRTIWVGGDSRGHGYLGDCSLWQNGSRSKIYGNQFQSGDIIQVTADLDLRKLSFYHNGQDLGIAFDKIPKVVYPAFSMFDCNDRISIQSYSSSDESFLPEYLLRIKTFKKKKLWIDVSRKSCGIPLRGYHSSHC